VHAHYPTWSPDGRFIYFVRGAPPDEMDLWRVPAAGGTPERLTFHNADVAYPAFIDDRTLIYRTPADDGSGPWLYAVDVERREPYRVSLGVERYLSISATTSGRRLAATVSNPTSELWTVPIGDEMTEERSAVPLEVRNVTAFAPRFGRDSIWYVSTDVGAGALWVSTGAGEQQIWRAGDGGVIGSPAPSPDGDRIAFVSKGQGRTRLHVMNSDGTGARTLADDLAIRDAPTWSPDGAWLAVATSDRLLRVPVDGGEPVPLVDGPARIPVWSPDGRFILYSESIQGGPGYPVKAVTPEGQPFPLPPFAVRRAGDRYRVMPGGRQVVFVVGDYGRQDFWLVDLDDGTRRRLTNLQPGFTIQGFDISSDGRRILFDRVRENADIVLIDLPPASNGGRAP
jgi:Tol biopolymer transport system component